MHFVLPIVVGSVALGLVALELHRWLRDPPPRLCPGPTPTGWRRLDPRRLVVRRACGYDLSAQIASRRGLGPCPECGWACARGALSERSLLRRAGRWRLLPIAMLLFAGAVVLLRHPPISTRAVVAAAPTEVLLRGATALGSAMPPEMRDELSERFDDGRLPPESFERYAAILVEELRGDRVESNARRATGLLHRWLGDAHPQTLLAALRSDDRQQRSRVADIVWNLLRGQDPPEALIRIAVDDLRSDDLVENALFAERRLAEHLSRAEPYLLAAFGSRDDQQREAAARLLFRCDLRGEPLERVLDEAIRSLGSGISRRRLSLAAEFLIRHAEEAESRLARAMVEGDARTKLIAAASAGVSRRTELLPLAMPILIEHLGQNDVTGDAIVAFRAIAGFGPAAIPFLEPSRASADQQRRHCVEHLIRSWTTSQSRFQLEVRFPLSKLSNNDHDPCRMAPEEIRWPEM